MISFTEQKKKINSVKLWIETISRLADKEKKPRKKDNLCQQM